MKALILAVSAAALATTLPASAQVLTVMGSFAQSCYRAAENRDDSLRALDACDRAFAQGLARDDEFATFVNRSIVLMDRNDYDSAKSDLARAIAMDPDRPEPWLNLAMLHFNQDDPARSIEMFTRALELGTPRPEIAYYGRGLANEDVGNLKAAYADLQVAREIAPDWTEPAEQLKRYRVVSR